MPRRGKSNKQYKKGYRLEYWIMSYLSYHGWHVFRRFRSLGVEDIVAVRKGSPNIFIQAKNSKLGSKAMTLYEIEELKEHAEEYGCIGIYVYSENRKKYWYNTFTDKTELINPIPQKIFKQWSDEVNKIKELKNIKSCNVYIPIKKVFMPSVTF